MRPLAPTTARWSSFKHSMFIASGAGSVDRFDHTEFLRKSEELAKINIDLENAIQAADRYAGAAGKRPLHRI